ncbi:hypothetical protein LAZ40_11670 [Cereibacter sphaeroides]|uniref:hypothetical protein n=1 Tax=Cereibacter sphaeroides TaxID=1063 RepID=UPI001F4622A3|nr:hypothetical protein [Cereibacter sphaeroides]MCE6959677.1 hypothetical protein [Cereibacter sphaeroides]MCE6974462.1 hypothetical protein [Cereibacter sphaeroides]
MKAFGLRGTELLLLTIRIAGTACLEAVVEDWALDPEGRLTFRASTSGSGDPVDEMMTLADLPAWPVLRDRAMTGEALPVSIWLMAETGWTLERDAELDDLLLVEEHGIEVRAEAAPLSLLIGEGSLRTLESLRDAPGT